MKLDLWDIALIALIIWTAMTNPWLIGPIAIGFTLVEAAIWVAERRVNRNRNAEGQARQTYQ
jgi:hypothetical protein